MHVSSVILARGDVVIIFTNQLVVVVFDWSPRDKSGQQRSTSKTRASNSGRAGTESKPLTYSATSGIELRPDRARILAKGILVLQHDAIGCHSKPLGFKNSCETKRKTYPFPARLTRRHLLLRQHSHPQTQNERITGQQSPRMHGGFAGRSKTEKREHGSCSTESVER